MNTPISAPKTSNRILLFTHAKGGSLYVEAQKIDAIFEDTYSVAHGKATCIMVGTVRHYVTESLGDVVATWDYALQLIAQGHL
jgi:hypothetical protein